MKKTHLRLISALFALYLTIPMFYGCSGEGKTEESTAADTVDSEQPADVIYKNTAIGDGILYAWEGDFSEEPLKKTIEHYQTNYTPFCYGSNEPVDFVSFETDFDIAGYTICRLSSVDDVNMDYELNSYIDLSIKSHLDGRKITIETDWWHRDNGVQKYPVWSYLVLVRDTEGGEHFYYFRVDYSSDNVNE